MTEEGKEQTILLKEIAKWLRFSGMKKVRETLLSILDDDSKKMAYHLSDGQKTTREIAKASGMGKDTVGKLWKDCYLLGLGEQISINYASNSIKPESKALKDDIVRNFAKQKGGRDVSLLFQPEGMEAAGIYGRKTPATLLCSDVQRVVLPCKDEDCCHAAPFTCCARRRRARCSDEHRVLRSGTGPGRANRADQPAAGRMVDDHDDTSWR
ncbi:MAG: hypothetical protein IH895_08785, partial [Planctomycetes bacterium]|nr:hypothetical protein [Planctomycetota bacterium]